MNRCQPLWQASAGGLAEDGHEPGGTAACALCGIESPTSLMVPDGGRACADVRWYCRDAGACTERWTAGLTSPGSRPGPG